MPEDGESSRSMINIEIKPGRECVLNFGNPNHILKYLHYITM